MFHPKGPTFLELARQAFSSTEQGYDLLAPKFDYTPFRTPEPLLEAAAKVIGGPHSIGSALDVCCGTGAAIRMLRPLCRERVVGIDFSRGMLDVCRERIEAMPGGAEVELVRGDALRTPFSEEFDVAVCFGALGHIVPGDERRFVGQVATTLKPGGRFVFASAVRPPVWSPRYLLSRAFNGAVHLRNLVHSPPFHMYYLRFLLPQVASLLREHGFRVEVLEGFLGRRATELRLVVATREPGRTV